jgi:hypothetical protein
MQSVLDGAAQETFIEKPWVCGARGVDDFHPVFSIVLVYALTPFEQPVSEEGPGVFELRDSVCSC